MVFLLIRIKIKADENAFLEDRIAYYTQLHATGEKILEQRQLERWIIIRAQELNYVNIPEWLK